MLKNMMKDRQNLARGWSSMINILEMLSIWICTIFKESLNLWKCSLIFIKNFLLNWNQFNKFVNFTEFVHILNFF